MLNKLINKTNIQYISVITSNVFTILFGFSINILATKLLSANEFGYYKAFLASLMLFGSLLNLGFHYTFSRIFALEKNNLNERSLNLVGLFLFFIIEVLFTVIFIFVYFVLRFIINYELESYLLIAGISTYVILIQFFLQQKFQGQSKIFSYSLLIFLPQFSIFIILFLIYVLKINFSSLSYVWIYILVNLLINLFFILKERLSLRNFKINLKNVIDNNINHGFQLYLGSLFNVTVTQLLSLIIARISGLEQFAFFSLGLSIAAPIAIIPQSFGVVRFSKNVSRLYINHKELFFTFLLTIIAVPIYLLAANYLFTQVIGSDYSKALVYANILSIYYVFMGLGDYFNKFINSKGLGKEIRNSTFCSGLVLIVSSSILIPTFGINGLILSKLISGTIYLLLMLLIYFKYINENKK